MIQNGRYYICLAVAVLLSLVEIFYSGWYNDYITRVRNAWGTIKLFSEAISR